MLFNSLHYLLFLPAVFLIHHFSPARFRWLVLLLASFAFYAALDAPHLLLTLLLVTTITYHCGRWLQRSAGSRARLRIMWGGIIANVLILGALKYLPFLTAKLAPLLLALAPGLILPTNRTVIAIGTSYFIFQAIAYLVDVYLEKVAPEKQFGYFTLYMSFFPKLLQGPIERAENLLPQLRQPYTFNYDNVRAGIVMFTWGLTKKIVVADRLAVFTNSVFGNVEAHSGLSLIIAVYFYAIQIYCDFSGYTDMARGTARMFNINLANNFNRPYLAESIREFWNRWHMSLSSWLQDYIFKPLQLQLRDFGKPGTTVALLLTFLICGVWHGATSGFLIWGLLHGIYLSISFLLKPYTSAMNKKMIPGQARIYKTVSIIFTFHLVALTWIPFRADSLTDAYYVISHLHSYLYEQLLSLAQQGLFNRNLKIGGQVGWNLLANIFALAVIASGSKLYKNYQQHAAAQPFTTRWLFYSYLLVALIMLGTNGSNNFIYLSF